MRIGEKIAIARELHARWADSLLKDPAISRGVRDLMARTESSRKSSVEAGVSEVCRRCDEEEGGSCCGIGLEDRYTPEMLLLNLLLGSSLPDSRQSDNSCHFLGAGGCMLAARDIICINYLCARLCGAITKEGLKGLQETTGREMEAVFVLHDRIRRILRCKTE
ncbi:MAG: hypothetical protein ABFD97_19805 [Syntrophobacter sp.]